MLIYRFRLTSETIDGFLREIEIQPNQTFLDFHHAILESVDVRHCDHASFFITDKMFKRGQEITLKNEKRKVRKYDEDLDIVVTDTETLPVMKVAKVKTWVEDPHQRMIYEMGTKEPHVFHIELYKIYRSEELASFPRCLRRNGDLPKAVQPIAPEPVAPPAMKVPHPHKPLLSFEALTKLDDIIEDEDEMKAIESEVVELFEAEAPVIEETGSPDLTDEAYTYEGQHSESGFDEDEEIPMEHLEDYDDIESLDRKISGYDRDSDDY